MRFEGKVAIVTGGASGIGEATVRRLHREGATLVVADIRQNAIDALLADMGSDRLLGWQVDMLYPDQVEAMVNGAAAHFGRLDILVNNAGIGSLGRVTEIDLAHWREVMAIDVEAVMWASRAAMLHLEAVGGNIVNVASTSGIAGDRGFLAYNAAKAAVINMSRSMALDHAPHVRVNVVSPGLTATPLAEGLTGHAELMAAWSEGLPLVRPADPSEVASAIAFLASRDASYVNGHNLVVDGGTTAWTGQPNFTRILGGQSHLEGRSTAIVREPEGGGAQ